MFVFHEQFLAFSCRILGQYCYCFCLISESTSQKLKYLSTNTEMGLLFSYFVVHFSVCGRKENSIKSDKVPFNRKPIFWVESNSAYPGLCGERLEESKQVIPELLLQQSQL